MTSVQAKTLAFYKAYIAEHGHSPSYVEVMAHMKLVSKSIVNRLVYALITQGKLRKTMSTSRSVEVVEEREFDREALAQHIADQLMMRISRPLHHLALGEPTSEVRRAIDSFFEQ